MVIVSYVTFNSDAIAEGGSSTIEAENCWYSSSFVILLAGLVFTQIKPPAKKHHCYCCARHNWLYRPVRSLKSLNFLSSKNNLNLAEVTNGNARKLYYINLLHEPIPLIPKCDSLFLS
ncbi:hypothetical protein Riv7116_5104 [Rivularia sp. PCC 7116]|nr:hypothetical protein Riv7116_5104 [Rivularia sp. PCC 7116]